MCIRDRRTHEHKVRRARPCLHGQALGSHRAQGAQLARALGFDLRHHRCIPVSYTHLDVYKRQLFVLLVGQAGLPAARLLACVPVIPVSIMMVMRNAKTIGAEYWGSYVDLGGICLLYTSAARRPTPVRICAANTQTSHRPYHVLFTSPCPPGMRARFFYTPAGL